MLACRHYRAEAIHQRDPHELRGEIVSRFLDQVARAKPKVLVLTGGYPLDIVAGATERGIPVAMSPNATPRLVKTDLCKFRDVGLKRVSLSIYGATRKTHSAFRGVKSTVDRTMKNIFAAREAGLEVQINTTFTRQNVGQFDESVWLLAKIEPSLWSVFQLVPTGRAQTTDLLSGEELETLFERLYELSLCVPYPINTTEGQHYRRVALQQWRRNPSISKPSPLSINDGNDFVFISHTGDIQPSGFLPINAGNVCKDELLDVYRESPLFRELRDADLLKGKCGYCEYRALCGGSRARAYAMTGDHLAEEPLYTYVPETISNFGVPTDLRSHANPPRSSLT